MQISMKYAGKTSLIIDDNASVRGTLKALMAVLGFSVDEAGDGEEALALLKTKDYSVVLCDLLMPHLRGDKLFVACLEFKPEMARRFIFITGSVGSAWGALEGSLMGQPCLKKPFRLAEIMTPLGQIVPASA